MKKMFLGVLFIFASQSVYSSYLISEYVNDEISKVLVRSLLEKQDVLIPEIKIAGGKSTAELEEATCWIYIMRPRNGENPLTNEENRLECYFVKGLNDYGALHVSLKSETITAIQGPHQFMAFNLKGTVSSFLYSTFSHYLDLTDQVVEITNSKDNQYKISCTAEECRFNYKEIQGLRKVTLPLLGASFILSRALLASDQLKPYLTSSDHFKADEIASASCELTARKNINRSDPDTIDSRNRIECQITTHNHRQGQLVYSLSEELVRHFGNITYNKDSVLIFGTAIDVLSEVLEEIAQKNMHDPTIEYWNYDGSWEKEGVKFQHIDLLHNGVSVLRCMKQTYFDFFKTKFPNVLEGRPAKYQCAFH